MDYFEFFIPRERLTSTSVRIFALWITLPAILIVAIAIIFLKNQTRPIKKLAEVSKKFGRGEDIDEFFHLVLQKLDRQDMNLKE